MDFKAFSDFSDSDYHQGYSDGRRDELERQIERRQEFLDRSPGCFWIVILAVVLASIPI